MSDEYQILKSQQPTIKLPTVGGNNIELEELKVNLLDDHNDHQHNEELMQQGPLTKPINLTAQKIGYQSPQIPGSSQLEHNQETSSECSDEFLNFHDGVKAGTPVKPNLIFQSIAYHD